MTPALDDTDYIVVNSSGGKDSQSALRQTVLEADRQGFPRSRILVSHQILGEIEWPGTYELVLEQANHYGLQVLTSKYRNQAGEEIDLLEYVRRRGKWPSPKQRYCTSEYKRGPGNRIIRSLKTEHRTRIIQVFGFRAQESPNRAKKKPLAANTTKITNSVRNVWDWLPIHDWTVEDVWQDINASGVRHHWAYDAGMPRLSCVFCIYAPKPALRLAAQHNPQLFEKYLKVERETGHTFKSDLALATIADELKTDNTTQQVPDWLMS